MRQSRVRSGAVVVALAFLAALLLSGCMSVELTATVSPDARFTGEMSLLLDKQRLRTGGIGSLEQLRQQAGEAASDNPRVQTTWAETDTQYVETVSFTDATPDEIEAAAGSNASPSRSPGGLSVDTSLSFPLVAEVHGDTMVVRLDQDGSTGTSDIDSEQVQALLRTAFADAKVSVAVTMPGDISSVTGAWPDGAKADSQIVVDQPDPATYEISAPVLSVIELGQRAPEGPALEITSAITSGPDAAAPGPADAGSASTSNRLVPLLIGGAVVLLVVVTLGLVLARRRSARAASGDSAAGPTRDSDPPA